ncbi:U-box domain-containing protein 34 [Apostasia shenzhenica]|uniref:RING-type E3 ubiquitin transferase n=1 Tax=Apostasia shenzhenica TaxID=1088818 RepID=A0A2I0ADG0_9ASPA|nr:U-box domain-containing protein 34 [Apostasia shenzhenica]
MRRNGSQLRASVGRDDTSGVPQLVAVAVDCDKNSQHALKWAADHVLSKNEIFVLLHIRRKITAIPTPSGIQIPITEVGDDVASTFLEQIDLQTKELLLPFQCFCSRRGLQCKEVILEDSDVPKAIADFVTYQSVDKLVLGASSRNLFMRTIKSLDVPLSVSKIAPEFCSVYVISKGKVSSVRPATHPRKNYVNKFQQIDATGNRFQSVKSTPEVGQNFEVSKSCESVRGVKVRYDRTYDNRVSEGTTAGSQHGGHPETLYHSIASCPSPSRPPVEYLENIYLREFVDSRGKLSPLSTFLNEYNYRGEQNRSFESKGYGNCWSDGFGSSCHENYPPVSQREAGSWLGNPNGNPGHSYVGITNSKLLAEEVIVASESTPAKMRSIFPLLESPQASKMSGTTTPAKQRSILPLPESPQSSKMFGATTPFKQRSMIPLLESPQATKMANETGNKYNTDHTWRQEMSEMKKELETISSDIRYRRYGADEIQKATENFSDLLKIGEGGYGPVFKSTLDHTLVAIKILRSDVAQGMKQFHKEVEVLSCIRHPNMVLLLGACPEFGCLVYEYMSNGSLEDRLFCSGGSPPLSWQLRFKIAAEVATGLLFLHQAKPEPLVHRDLKPGNILLDCNFVGKIADVGLARLLPPPVSGNSTQYHMTAAAGTFCYIDPEYQKTGMVSTKSDIYALGIILLQIITAREPMGLAHNIENAMENGDFHQMLDPNVQDWPLEATMKLATIGLKCAELRRRDRPDLATVVLPQLNDLRTLAESTFEPSWSNSSWNLRSLRVHK